MQNIDNLELKELAESLPSFALCSKAPATVKKYAEGFSIWKKWARLKPGIEAFPAKPFQFALYLAFLIQSAKTSAPVEEAVNSISCAHQLAAMEDLPIVHLLNRFWLVPSESWLKKQQRRSPLLLKTSIGCF